MIDARMKRLVDRHGDILGGLFTVAVIIGLVIWIAPSFDFPFREVGIAVAALAIGYGAIFSGEWLRHRNAAPLKWVGSAFTGLGVIIMATLLFGLVGLVVWAKFNAPPSYCAQCD